MPDLRVRTPVRWIGPTALVLTALGASSVALLVYSDATWRRNVRRYVPLLDNVTEARVKLAVGHLWLEEMIMGDESIRPEDVWGVFDQMGRALESGLSGRTAIPALEGLPLTDPALVERLEDLKAGVEQFRSIAVERWENPEAGGIGSDIDQRFDTVFRGLDHRAGEIDALVHRHLSAMVAHQSDIQVVTLVLWMLAVGGAGGGLLFVERRRRHAESDVRRVNRALQAIRCCNQALVRATGESGFLDDVCRIIVEVGGYRLAWVGLAEQDDAGSVRPVARAGHDEGYVEAANITWRDDARGRGPTGTAIRERGPHVSRYIRTDQHFEPWRAEATRRGFESSAAFPLMVEGQAIGALNIYADKADAFDSEETGLLAELADDLASGLASLRTRAAHARAAAALRESEERFRLLYERAPIAYQALDERGHFLTVNETWLATLGYEREEVIGRWFGDFVSAEYVEHFRRNFPCFKSAGEIHGVQFEMKRKDGLHILARYEGKIGYDEEGEFVQTHCILQDITERARAEEALRASEQRFRSLVHTAPNVIVCISPDHQITEFNRVAERLYGYRREEVLGKSYFKLFLRAEIHDAVAADIKKVLSGTPTREFENVVKACDGSEHSLLWNVDRLLDAEDQPIGVIACGLDITERKQAEAELSRYRKRLEELVTERTRQLEAAQAELLRKERLATLGQLTATVSHELRNPLGTIRSSFFIIRRGTEGKELGIERALERADRSIERCDGIIEELLDYTRTRETTLVATGVDAWLAGVLDEQVIPDGVTLERRLGSGGRVQLDRERLRRCVVNVITNACQAMMDQATPGGRLTVETRTVGDRVEIRVKDAGPGISPQDLERIFEPLYSTRSFGAGLGLPIVKQIMQQHRGGVEIESETGQGTEVILWLPLVEAKEG